MKAKLWKNVCAKMSEKQNAAPLKGEGDEEEHIPTGAP
jgi:hypothetical protein